MAVRAAMTEIIARLRVMTDTVDTTDEAKIDYGVWTDERLQQMLDIYGRQTVTIQLQPTVNLAGAYLVYNIDIPTNYDIERDATFVNGAGETVVMSYTADYDTRQLTFLADTNGASIYMEGAIYDLGIVAAEVWQQKADLRSSLIRAKAGDHTLYEEQEYEHCKERAKYYRGTRLQTSRMRGVGYAPI